MAFNQQQRQLGPPYGLVWAHQISGHKSPYGGMQLPGQIRTYQAAKADGIDGITFDCFAKASTMDVPLQAADQTGLLMAPEIDMSILFLQKHYTPDQIVQAQTQVIVDYCNMAGSHPSAAKTRDGRYIIWEYGAFELDPDQQQQSLDNARAQGAKFYMVGALGKVHDADGGDPVSSMTPYAQVWDASYAFLPLDDSVKPGVKAAFVTQFHRPFIATVMPQYTRPGMKIYLPPDGGARYAAMWQEAINDRAPAVIIVTLNDDHDGSNIMPDYEAQTRQFTQQYKSTVLGR